MNDLSKIIKNLSSKSPIFGKRKRKKAIEELGKIGSKEVVPYLIESLKDPDINIKRAAFLEISRLKDHEAINYLCLLYLKERDEKIWEIITSKGFTPSSPKERLNFLIKTGQTAKCIPPKEEDIPILLEMFKDEALNKEISRILSSIDNTLKEVVFNIFLKKPDTALLTFLTNMRWLPQNEGKRLIFYLFLKRDEDALFMEKRKKGAFTGGYKSLGKEGRHIITSILLKNPNLLTFLYLLIELENDPEALRFIFKTIIENNIKDALLFFLKRKSEDVIINIMSSLSLSNDELLEIGLEKGGAVLCMAYTLLKKKGWKADTPILSEFIEEVGNIVDSILKVNIGALSSKDKRFAISILSKIRSEDVVDNLIPLLKDTNPRIRRMASNCLVAISGKRVVDTLIKLFKEEDWSLRVICAETLGRIGERKVIEFLEKGALEEKWGGCEEAFISLAKLSPPSSLNTFIKGLRCNNKTIRKIAASSLGKIGGEETIKVLIRALEDRDEITRLHAAYSIAHISKRYNLPLPLLGKSIYVKHGIIKAMGLKKDELNIDFLLNSLSDNDVKTRVEAIKSLGMIGKTEFIKPIIKMLGDEKIEVKREAAKSLCILGEEKGFGVLVDAMKSKNWKIQMQTAYIISNYVIENRERALKMFAEMIKDQNPQNRLASIISLGMMKDEKSVPTLLMGWTQERETKIKERIITSLINIGSEKGQRAFTLGLVDKEQGIRISSARAFGRLRIKEGFAPLIEKIDSFDEKGREAIFLSLREIIEEFGLELNPKNLALLDKKIKGLDENKGVCEMTQILLLRLCLSLLKYKKRIQGNGG